MKAKNKEERKRNFLNYIKQEKKKLIEVVVMFKSQDRFDTENKK